MSKILITLFVLFFSFSTALASNDLKIISRSEWGADETYRYLDSKDWQQILEKWHNAPKPVLTEYQKKRAKIEAEKVKKANNFLTTNFADIISIGELKKEENGHKLAWPIAYAKKKTAIIVHHTDSGGDIKDSYEAVRKIYKYHALTRAWGDIGYNYLIGKNGEIFEGRAGGDYVVGAHDKWNNQATIGIALIGNFNKNKPSKKQLDSLEKLIKNLVEKYDIDLSEKQAFFKWCNGIDESCQQKPIIINYDYPIIGHRDAGYTSCPGEKLYKDLQVLKQKLGVGKKTKEQLRFLRLKNKLKKFKEKDLLDLLVKVELSLDSLEVGTKSIAKMSLLTDIKNLILDIEKHRNKKLYFPKENSFDDNNKIKVKLSYPLENTISFKLPKGYTLAIKKTKKEQILTIYKSGKGVKRDKNIDLLLKNNKLFSGKKEITDFGKIDFFRIKNQNGIIEISSWNRKPAWDKSGELNDNKFRGDIILYPQNNKLTVVNELYLTDYLKGLGEISDFENTEKIKTIIILARTYARWYMTKARKFVGEWYDASDDPNVFQKYLGFGLEQRSPNVNKIVEQTKDFVITYEGELIKPWYFSSSDGETKSFLEYCKTAKGVPDCAHPEKFPFLVSVKDPGAKENKAGHGVGVAGSGVKYFSEKGWFSEIIIKYFLKGVDIIRL